MKASRVAAIIVGALLLLPGLAMFLGGGALGLAYSFGRDDGYFEVSLDRLQTTTVAIAAKDLDLTADPGDPDWLLRVLDVDIRVKAFRVDADDELFVGIGPEADVDAYLSGVAHDEIENVDGQTPEYRRRTGSDVVEPPTEQGFWEASATGPGDQVLTWEAESGRWAIVLMNADGSPGVVSDVDVGARSDFVLPMALILMGLGVVLIAAAVALIVGAVSRHHAEQPPEEAAPPPTVPEEQAVVEAETPVAEPVALDATLDPDLSQWQWLVKWFLAIPHFVVLVFLWIAFVVMTVIAGVAILFTGRYPSGIFDFNVGVLRWSWRVWYYAGPGGLGTDRYPPFSLDDDPTYPARLHVEAPGQLSRGLVLVKWWLLAIPHYLIVGALLGDVIGPGDIDGFGLSLLGVLVLVAAVTLLFTGRYPPSLFDLVIGLNRWVYRVAAYAALMTDRYPPFRLDQGGSEPVRGAGPVAAEAGPGNHPES